jgi:hypothetical protein
MEGALDETPLDTVGAIRFGGISEITTVRLNVEENQLVDVFGEIGTCNEGLKNVKMTVWSERTPVLLSTGCE